MAVPDYRLDGFRPASERTEADFEAARITEDLYAGLAAHHTADGRESFLLLYDGAAVWDGPGTAEYVGMHLTRNLRERTFAFDAARRPTLPLAQNWLVSRGCPSREVEPDRSVSARPADAATSRLEDRLRENPEGRYTLLDHHTRNPGARGQGIEVSLLLHDAHPEAAEAPYRVFLEETVPSFETYTVREGAFPSQEAARHWLRRRDTPLPAASGPSAGRDQRAAAARSRTTAADAPSSTREPAPPPGQPRPTRSRSVRP